MWMCLCVAHVQVLDSASFPCGKQFFEQPRRMFSFDSPCQSCVAIHNNWVVGSAAKVFRCVPLVFRPPNGVACLTVGTRGPCRFKEHVQWFVDTDEYYSSSTAKYLEVGNPDPRVTKDQEAALLKAAMKLGRATGRIVILPEFKCHGCVVTGAGGTKTGCSGVGHFRS